MYSVALAPLQFFSTVVSANDSLWQHFAVGIGLVRLRVSGLQGAVPIRTTLPGDSQVEIRQINLPEPEQTHRQPLWVRV